MRYVISDIHGEYELFRRLMKKISFSQNDELYVCGDFLEKGEGSVALAKLLLSKDNIHCIRGNHEELFIDYYHTLMRESEDYGYVLGSLRRYIQGDGHLLDWETVEAIESLPYYIEKEDFICVHAGVPLSEGGEIPPLESIAERELLFNRRFKSPEVLPKGKCVFFGHTQTPDGLILGYRRRGSAYGSIRDFSKIWLDCGAWCEGGRLGVFCIDTLKCTYVKK